MSLFFRYDRDMYRGSESGPEPIQTKRLFLFCTYDARSGQLPAHDLIRFDSAQDLIWDTPFVHLSNDIHDAGLSLYLDYCFRNYLLRVSQSEYERYYKRAFQAHHISNVDEPLSYSEYLRFLFTTGLNRFFHTWIYSGHRLQLAGPGSMVEKLDSHEDPLTIDLFQFSSRILDFRTSSDVVSLVLSPIVPDYDPLLQSWHKTFVQYFQDRRDHFVVKSDRLRSGVAPCDVDADNDIVL